MAPRTSLSGGLQLRKSQMRIVSSCELETIWNSSNCNLNTLPECSTSVRIQRVPVTTSRSWYCRHAIPRLCPFSVRTNSHELVDQTLMVRSPLADTMYFSSKSTTFTAALCPTRTRLRLISVGLIMSQTAMLRSLLHVTIIPFLKLKLRWRTASQWWISVLTISPVSTSHTRTVLSEDP